MGWHLEKPWLWEGTSHWSSAFPPLAAVEQNKGILTSSALLKMPLKSANVSSSCITRMGCLNDNYRWRSSWFWYYNVYTPATRPCIWEMQRPESVQMGNQKTELILLKAPSKGQLQITQFIAVVLWHPMEKQLPEIKGQVVFLFRVLKLISKQSLVMRWNMELEES